MQSRTAYLDSFANGTVEMQFTTQLHRRRECEIVWISDEFDPGLLQEGDDPLLMELGDRLRRSDIRAKITVRLYKVVFEVDASSLEAGKKMTQALRQVIATLEAACKACDEDITLNKRHLAHVG